MHPLIPRLIPLLPLVALAVAQAAFAQGAKAYPDKPVRVIVGYSPGGLPDTIARVVGQKLSERWGQQFVVENKPGANGILGAEFVAKAAPDGYTLLMTDVKIGADMAEVVKQPDVVVRMKNLGIDPVGLSGEEWTVMLKADAERYSKAVKISGAKAE